MSNPVVPEAMAAGDPVPPDPRDKLGALAKFWMAWLAAFCIAEGIALYIEKKRRDAGNKDRVKRTLSAFTRWLGGWNSTTGQPVDVPYGRLRRAAFIMFCAWFVEHIKRTGTENRV